MLFRFSICRESIFKNANEVFLMLIYLYLYYVEKLSLVNEKL